MWKFIKKMFKVIGTIFKVLSLSLVGLIIIVSLCIGGAYLKYKPFIDAAQADAFNKEGSISDTTFKRAENTIIYDKDDKEIAKITNNTYKYIPLSNASSYITQGYIAVEDKDYLTEGGINYKEIAKAAYLYVKNKGKATVGGSTITQQLIKNVLLTQDKTISRKLTEIILAVEINKRYTKSQILEFYINNCYYGEGCYGVESASQHYFSKPASGLTLAESATLVGLSNNPTMFSPTQKPDSCIQRRNIALYAMLTQNRITQTQYDQAKIALLTLSIQKPSAVDENYMTSYAVDCTVRALMAQDGFKFQYIFNTDAERKAYRLLYAEAYQANDKKIRSGGYTIYTSLDTAKQKILQASLDSNLSDYTETDPVTKKYAMQGASVSIDNKTGYVVAIVGGRGETDLYNRAFLSFRQPGSSIKPVLDYTPAFDLGYHPGSIITDQQLPNGPKNDENQFFGPVTIRYATEMSLNTVAYQVLTRIKPKTGLAYLGELGYSGLHPEDNNPIASIGGFTEGVSPVEHAGGYETIANQGVYVQPSCVREVKFLGTEEVYKNNSQGKQVYTPESAYMMTDVLKGVISTDYGTGHALKIDGQIVAGKTGTTEESKDAWFCGYSAYYTTVVWCGYDTPRATDMYGGGNPGHIWLDYMTQIHQGLPELDFTKPAGIVVKNIDWQGNIVNYDTGTQDMFSQPYLTKAAEDKRVNDLKIAADKQAAWDLAEPVREGSAENLVMAYEKLHYTSRDSIDTVDQAYDNANSATTIVDDATKKADLSTRLEVHKATIAIEKQLLQDTLAKEQASKAAQQKIDDLAAAKADAEAVVTAKQQADAELVAIQQAEVKAESTADNTISKLEGLQVGTDKAVVKQAITDSQTATALVTDTTKHAVYLARITAASTKLGN